MHLGLVQKIFLEKLGLKAVAAGANPQQLQQAFATAQIKGDWAPLEKKIASVLGIEAINHPEVGLAISSAQKPDRVDNTLVTNTQQQSTSSGLPK